MTLVKATLREKLIDEVEFEKGVAADFVDSFFSTISDTLVAGENVKLSGFGNFVLRDKPARPGRNPKTREPVEISARRVVTFRSGMKLRDRIAEEGQNV